jgi:hypothetical protein
MTGLRRLLTCVLTGAFLSTVSCGGEGGTVVDPEQTEVFNVLTGCSGDCFAGFTQMINGFNELMVLLAAGDTASGDPSLNLTTGAFGFDMDMDGRSGKEIQFRGSIDPLTIDVCDDGMVKGDICILEWDMFRQPTGAHRGEGTFSVIGMGNAGPPYSTPSYRVTITRENTWIETEDGCRLSIHGLGLGLHPFSDPQLFSAVVEFKITTIGIVDEVRGGLYYSYDPTPGAQQTASFIGQHDIGSTTTDFSCSINMDTFALDCS